MSAIPANEYRQLELLQTKLQGATAEEIVRAMVCEMYPGRIAAVSAFGPESAVLLHMIALADRATPVIFLDTGKHFRETIAYRDMLVERLRLVDVRSVAPDPEALANRDPSGDLWSTNSDACCHLRKVAPLETALQGFEAWFTGRKAYQTTGRADLPFFEAADARIKVNPLARWDRDMVESYLTDRSLPRHPLADAGYISVGCQPCTTPVAAGEAGRTGRWRGSKKDECGIHLPRTASETFHAYRQLENADPHEIAPPCRAVSSNVFAVDHAVTVEERATTNGHRGGVLWLTGLSGAGKSTVAMALERRLFDQGWQVFTLDGDNLRHGLNGDLGFSPDDRDENIRRSAETARLLAETGVLVIATFISPLRRHRQTARDIVGWDFHEVFIDADLGTCEARDTKGLYAKARAGEIPEFTGVSAPYEAPARAEVHLDTSSRDIEGCVAELEIFARRVLNHDAPRREALPQSGHQSRVCVDTVVPQSTIS